MLKVECKMGWYSLLYSVLRNMAIDIASNFDIIAHNAPIFLTMWAECLIYNTCFDAFKISRDDRS